MGEKLLVIDGSSLLSTVYYATLPKQILFEKDAEKQKEYYHLILQSADGTYTNGIYGFVRALTLLLDKQNPSHIMIAFDKSRNTFRRQIYADYKGNRSATPDPLKQQFVTLENLLAEAGFAVECSDDYEADDLVGSVVEAYAGIMPIRIHTKDQDYFQLVNDDKNVRLWLVMQKEKKEALEKAYSSLYTGGEPIDDVTVPYNCFEFTEETVEDFYGVTPKLVPDLKGIIGDTSDNIPGVKGVSSAASLLLKEYGSLEGIYDAIESCSDEKELVSFWKNSLGISRSPIKALKEYKDSAFLSKDLATIRRNCTLSNSLNDMNVKNVDMEKFRKLCLGLGMKTLY